MGHRTERAYWVDEGIYVIVDARGAHVTLVSYSLPPGIQYHEFVSNEDLIFAEEEETDGM